MFLFFFFNIPHFIIFTILSFFFFFHLLNAFGNRFELLVAHFLLSDISSDFNFGNKRSIHYNMCSSIQADMICFSKYGCLCVYVCMCVCICVSTLFRKHPEKISHTKFLKYWYLLFLEDTSEIACVNLWVEVYVYAFATRIFSLFVI